MHIFFFFLDKLSRLMCNSIIFFSVHVENTGEMEKNALNGCDF